MSDDPKVVAGEILRLMLKGTSRDATEERRLADLRQRFGDHEAAAIGHLRAIGKS